MVYSGYKSFQWRRPFISNFIYLLSEFLYFYEMKNSPVKEVERWWNENKLKSKSKFLI